MAQLDAYTSEQWVQLARQCMFSAPGLAKKVGVCERQLQRYTKIHFGQSPQKWLDEQRLLFAAELLRDGPAFGSVKRVAFDLGYKQLSHFSRNFKSRYGIPPTEFIVSRRKSP